MPLFENVDLREQRGMTRESASSDQEIRFENKTRIVMSLPLQESSTVVDVKEEGAAVEKLYRSDAELSASWNDVEPVLKWL